MQPICWACAPDETRAGECQGRDGKLRPILMMTSPSPWTVDERFECHVGDPPSSKIEVRAPCTTSTAGTPFAQLHERTDVTLSVRVGRRHCCGIAAASKPPRCGDDSADSGSRFHPTRESGRTAALPRQPERAKTRVLPRLNQTSQPITAATQTWVRRTARSARLGRRYLAVFARVEVQQDRKDKHADDGAGCDAFDARFNLTAMWRW